MSEMNLTSLHHFTIYVSSFPRLKKKKAKNMRKGAHIPPSNFLLLFFLFFILFINGLQSLESDVHNLQTLLHL